MERDIAEALKNVVLSEEGIAALAHASYEQQMAARNAPDADLLESQLRETEKALKNILAAIEQGIFTISTRDRLQELEGRKALLTEQLTAARKDQDEIIRTYF